MKSYRLTQFGKPLEPEEHATPEPRGSEVLLQVLAAGVCHTDLHLCDGGYELGDGKRLSLTDRGVTLPITLGHETVGRVVAMGPDANGVRAGQTCVVFPWIGCGACPTCEAGNDNFCAKPRFLGVLRNGGYADHILVPHARYLLDLAGLDPAAAAPYACSGVTTYSALKKAGPVIRQRPIVILGAGGLGLISLGLLKAMGGVGAVVTDVDPHKLAAARSAGALAAVDAKAPDAVDQIVRAAGGPPPVVIDLVGSEKSAALGFDCLPKAGKLILVGLFGGSARWPLPLIAMKAITIQGNYVGNLGELAELLDLVRRERVAPIPITRTPLAQVNQTLHKLRQGEVLGRAILTP